ncbi:MAG: RluA family pseudouridine synthase [Phycisphaeraceae bacterium]|nr:RluA family pseudouridine synthase [Phycisphaeraceae bacterium]
MTPSSQPPADDEPILDAELDEDEPIDAEIDDDAEPAGEHYRWVLGKDAKSRIDKYLQNRIRSISRNKIQQLIELGNVTVNGKTTKPSAHLREGDVVEASLPPRPSFSIEPEHIPVEVLYEDDDLIVINKPAGMIVHPARGQLSGTLLNALAWHFQQQGSGDLSDVGKQDARPGVVHRLDRNTTGVIVVAKRDETHWLISKQFEHRTNLKCYLAVVHGCPDPPCGAVDEPIGRHPTVHEAMAVRHDSAGRHALTLYRLRERYKGYSLMELELKTGRTHQLRVHLEYIGHPIVGDIIYGGEPIGPAELDEPPHAKGSRPFLNFATTKPEGLKIYEQIEQRGDVLMSTPALHAALLQLRHPVTNRSMTFTAPVPSPMKDLIRELRQRTPNAAVSPSGGGGGGWHVDLEQATGEK